LAASYRLVRYFLGAADPIHYAARFPHARLFQNGTQDVLVPRGGRQGVAGCRPGTKKITWYESDHVGINLEHTKRVLETDSNGCSNKTIHSARPRSG